MPQEIATVLPAATPKQIAENDGKGWPERAITVNYDLHLEDLKVTSDHYSEGLVKALFRKQAVVYIQGNIRRLLKAGKTDADIIKFVSELNLEDILKGRARKSASEKIADLFKGMSKEQKVAAMRVMKGQLNIGSGDQTDQAPPPSTPTPAAR